MNAYRLYLVTDDQQDLATLKRVVRKAVEGGVTMVQVREKHGECACVYRTSSSRERHP